MLTARPPRVELAAGSGGEPPPRHRVGSWVPVIPVKVVPGDTGGDKQLHLLGDDGLSLFLEPVGPDLALVGHTAPLLVGTLPPPCEQRIVTEPNEPGADEGIAAAELVI
jgi:hypothetical protein